MLKYQMQPLNSNIHKAVEKLFPNEHKTEAVHLLSQLCAGNLPDYEDADELEDLIFRVLKLSDGNIDKLRSTVKIANEDWREIIVSSGSVSRYKRDLLGGAPIKNNNFNAAQYFLIWDDLGAIVTFLCVFTLQLSHTPIFLFTVAVLVIATIYTTGRLLFIQPCHDLGDNKLEYVFLTELTFIGLPAVTGYFVAYLVGSILMV
jgi:hypothetical protein